MLSGRLLAAHWPALIAWFLAGILARHLLIELAGFVGAYSALGGLLILPVAILARVVSVVAMFLVLRDGMPRLGAIAPPPTDRSARRQAFFDALLSAILPLIAVYALLGFLRDDVAAYLAKALEVHTQRLFEQQAVGEPTTLWSGADGLALEPWTVAVVVLAFGGRWAWKRWNSRLPRWSVLAAVYLEGLWIFLVAYFVTDVFGQVTTWVQSRQAMAWLGDLRGWLGDLFAPLGWTWDAVGWLVGELGALVLVPLAWLTVAGVIYGRAVEPRAVSLRSTIVDRARTRYASVPQRLRRRLTDIGSGMGARLRPIWRAVVLMWQGGPILIGGYVLLYSVVLLGETYLGWVVTRLFGPQDFGSFWLVADSVILLLVPLVIEPVRTVLVASAYDATVGALIGAPVVDSGRDDESEEARRLVREHEVEAERSDRLVGDEIGDGKGERPPAVDPA